jgi:hypothetical protein
LDRQRPITHTDDVRQLQRRIPEDLAGLLSLEAGVDRGWDGERWLG